jgi:thiol-disulfide isomerase/thioredoxin
MYRTLPLLLLVLAGCDDGAGVGIKTGQRAPEFLARDSEGNAVKLSDFRGKVVLLDFWATWCGPCVMSIPHEKQLVKKFEGKPFVMIGVSLDRSADALNRFLSINPLPWRNIYEGAEELSDVWEVSAVPTFVLIDHEGIVRGRWEGADLENVEKRLKGLLAKIDSQ